jgi:Flp pilus assembly pilin Flp
MAFDFTSLSPITAYTYRESVRGFEQRRTVCALDGGCGKTNLLRGGDESLKRTFVMPNLKKRLSGLWADESGVSAVEYVLLLAIVGGALIFGAVELGNVVADRLSETASCLQTNGGTC